MRYVCGVLIVVLLLFTTVAVADSLPENVVEISNQDSISTFYLEDENKIEIYTCSILTVNKTEVYPDETEEEVEEETEKNNDQNDDTDSDRFSGNVINPPTKYETPESDTPNDTEDDMENFNVEEFGVGCNPSWFCQKWEFCFMDKADCYKIAQENDCNYDKLYSLIIDCTTEDENLTTIPQEEIELSTRTKTPIGLAFGVVAIPLISMFALDRYLRQRKQKTAKQEEDIKIAEIRKKYADD